MLAYTTRKRLAIEAQTVAEKLAKSHSEELLSKTQKWEHALGTHAFEDVLNAYTENLLSTMQQSRKENGSSESIDQ